LGRSSELESAPLERKNKKTPRTESSGVCESGEESMKDRGNCANQINAVE